MCRWRWRWVIANIKGILQKAFPFISAALAVGGPLGALASNVIGAALNTKAPDPTLDAVSSVIAGATPDQMVALKQAEMSMQVQLTQMGFANAAEVQSLADQDLASARARQVALKDWTAPALAWVIVLGAFSLMAYILSGKAHVEAALAGSLIGYSVAMAQNVVTYYFGSSAGSAAKTDILAKMTNGNGVKV